MESQAQIMVGGAIGVGTYNSDEFAEFDATPVGIDYCLQVGYRYGFIGVTGEWQPLKARTSVKNEDSWPYVESIIRTETSTKALFFNIFLGNYFIKLGYSWTSVNPTIEKTDGDEPHPIILKKYDVESQEGSFGGYAFGIGMSKPWGSSTNLYWYIDSSRYSMDHDRASVFNAVWGLRYLF